MKKQDYITKCERCLNGDKCRKLESKNCKEFVVTVDSNFRYIFEPDLLAIEKQSKILALCL